MAQIIQKISVDVSKPNFFQAIVAKQYDSGTRFVKATFIHNNEKVYIEPTATVTINATRCDGSKDSFAGVVNDDGTATLPLTYWMLELVGTVKCDISVLSGDSRLTSTSFDLEVEKASNNSGDVSEDESYDVLLSLIERVEAIENIESTTNKVTEITKSSTHDQYPTAKAVYDEFQTFNKVTRLEKSDFVNGAFVSNKGIVASDLWIIMPNSVKVSVGDKVEINVATGFNVWLRVFDSQDLATATMLKSVGMYSREAEYVSEFNGYFNVQISKTDSTTITPEEYECLITITSSRLKKVEGDIEDLISKVGTGGTDIEILSQVDVTGNHTNEQIYGALALDEAFNVFSETLDEKQDKIKNKVFEEIATVTVTPDDNGDLPTKISITKDKDGNSFSLSDVYCETLIGMTDYSKGRFYVLAGGLTLIGNAYLDLRNETLRKWCFRYDSFGEGNGGICTAPGSAIATTAQIPSGNNSNLYGQPIPPGKEININTVEFVGQVGEPKTFMEGTTITLWGVRK